MKIAVPTNDGAALSEHFGRSAAFLVFEIDGAQIKSREMRENQPHHAGSHEDCQHGSGGHGGGHDHGAIVSLLADCDVVLCGGMGRRAADALKAAGISLVPTAASGQAEELVRAYVAGKLPPAGAALCGCSH